MRRRDFIKGMAGSAAATWSLAALAQQAGKYAGSACLCIRLRPNPKLRLALRRFCKECGMRAGRLDAIYASNIAGAWAILRVY
ncbi:MAG: hypothetical protein WB052_08970 [Pseudolabrys sp.]